MPDLTIFGVIHAIISMTALLSGLWVLVRDRKITLNSRLGRIYVTMTMAAAASSLFIFHHGGFGLPHASAILTLLLLPLAIVAERSKLFGRAAGYIAIVGYVTPMLFHLIGVFTETLLRLPPSDPVLSSIQAPEFKVIYGGLLLAYFIELAWQCHTLAISRQPITAQSVAVS